MLEGVDEYNYLGHAFSADPNHGKEIRRRIRMGWGAFAKQFQLLSKD